MASPHSASRFSLLVSPQGDDDYRIALPYATLTGHLALIGPTGWRQRQLNDIAAQAVAQGGLGLVGLGLPDLLERVRKRVERTPSAAGATADPDGAIVAPQSLPRPFQRYTATITDLLRLADAPTLTAMIADLLAGGSPAEMMWTDRAVTLAGIVLQTAVELRDTRGLVLSIGTLYKMLVLDTIISLYCGRPITIKGKSGTASPDDPTALYLPSYQLSDETRDALRTFLSSVPGYSADKAEQGLPQGNSTYDQVGYLTMQLGRPLSVLANLEQYGGERGGQRDLEPAFTVGGPVLWSPVNLVGRSNDAKMFAATQHTLLSHAFLTMAKASRAPNPTLVLLEGEHLAAASPDLMALARAAGIALIIGADDITMPAVRQAHTRMTPAMVTSGPTQLPLTA